MESEVFLNSCRQIAKGRFLSIFVNRSWTWSKILFSIAVQLSSLDLPYVMIAQVLFLLSPSVSFLMWLLEFYRNFWCQHLLSDSFHENILKPSAMFPIFHFNSNFVLKAKFVWLLNLISLYNPWTNFCF